MSFFSDAHGDEIWQTPEELPFPWKFDDKATASIYKFLADVGEEISKGAKEIDPYTVELPDADFYYEYVMDGDDTYRNIPGAADSLISPEFQNYVDDLAPQIITALQNVLTKPSRSRLQAFYQIARDIPPMAYIDELTAFVDELEEHQALAWQSLGYAMMLHAPDREAVKLGILMTAMLEDQEVWPIYQTVGWHEEFTSYAVFAVALTSENCGADPREVLIEFAKSTKGWGKIYAVEMICKCKDLDEGALDWLVAEGHQNIIDPVMMAQLCAERVDLAEVLTQDNLSDEALTGAGKILNALIISTDETGQLEAILDYDDGLKYCQLYVEAVKGRPLSVFTYLVITNIMLFLKANTGDPGAAQFMVKIGWPVDQAKQLVKETTMFLRSGAWKEVIEQALKSDDSEEFFWALAAAEDMKEIDEWQYCLERQKARKDALWPHLLKSPYPERLDEALALAEEQLELPKLCTGPKLNFGMGQEYQDFIELEMIVESLFGMMYGGQDGRGWAFLKAAMQSPIVPLRCMALEVFYSWDGRYRNDEMRSFIQEQSFQEPEPDLKAIMLKVAKGQKVAIFEEEMEMM